MRELVLPSESGCDPNPNHHTLTQAEARNKELHLLDGGAGACSALGIWL